MPFALVFACRGKPLHGMYKLSSTSAHAIRGRKNRAPAISFRTASLKRGAALPEGGPGTLTTAANVAVPVVDMAQMGGIGTSPKMADAVALGPGAGSGALSGMAAFRAAGTRGGGGNASPQVLQLLREREALAVEQTQLLQSIRESLRLKQQRQA